MFTSNREFCHSHLDHSIAGDPSYWREFYQNGVYRAAKYGTHNTLFVTFTTNPEWTASKLLAEQNADRPSTAQCPNAYWDIHVRAYIDARERVHKILKSGIFLPAEIRRAARWYISVIESQIRGLLHGHLIFHYGGEPWSIAAIDNIVWAHKPLPQEEELFQQLYGKSLTALVEKHMTHKCSDYCHGNTGPCRFGFPFATNPATYVDDSGHLMPWRRAGDERVAPYCPHLLMAAEAHIHTTVAIGTGTIAYMCSYAGKGDSCARLAIVEAKAKEHRTAESEHRSPKPVDALTVYERHRITTASEAFAHILQQRFAEGWPPVTAIYIHPPGKGSVRVQPEQDPQAAANRFVNACDRYLGRPAVFHNLSITEFFGQTKSKAVRVVGSESSLPKIALENGYHQDHCDADPHFVWRRRPQDYVLARVMPVHKLNSEGFWLRQLLALPDTKPTSLADLLTFDGQAHATFAEVADARGLVRNARMAQLVLHEEVHDTLTTPERLRSLMCIMLHTLDAIGDPLDLIDTYLDALSNRSWPAHQRRSLILRVRRDTICHIDPLKFRIIGSD